MYNIEPKQIHAVHDIIVQVNENLQKLETEEKTSKSALEILEKICNASKKLQELVIPKRDLRSSTSTIARINNSTELLRQTFKTMSASRLKMLVGELKELYKEANNLIQADQPDYQKIRSDFIFERIRNQLRQAPVEGQQKKEILGIIIDALHRGIMTPSQFKEIFFQGFDFPKNQVPTILRIVGLPREIRNLLIFKFGLEQSQPTSSFEFVDAKENQTQEDRENLRALTVREEVIKEMEKEISGRASGSPGNIEGSVRDRLANEPEFSNEFCMRCLAKMQENEAAAS